MHPTRSTSIHKRTLTDIKGKMDRNTVIVGDFNTPLTPMDRSSKLSLKTFKTLNKS